MKKGNLVAKTTEKDENLMEKAVLDAYLPTKLH